MKKLAIVTTHPIQYYAPVFRLLAAQLELKVFYTAGKSHAGYDHGFRQHVEWDLPLLEDYNFEFVANTAKDPGSHHFNGVTGKDVIRAITHFHPDAVLVYGWAYQAHLGVLRHFKNKLPIFFRGDSTLTDRSPFWRSVLRSLLLKWVYTHVDHAFYVGSHNKRYFQKYGLKMTQLSFAPHAVENDRFAEQKAAEAAELRKSLGIPPTDILVLFAGKLEPKKNPMALIDAFTQLNQNGVQLLFVGGGILEEELKNKVIELAADKIHFLPFQNQQQMPVIYQACDLFCLPSIGPGETWGLAINEAMAAGKAILASHVTGAAVDLVDDTNGKIFNVNKPADLGNKLAELTANKQLLKKMGDASAIKIKNWNFETQVKAIIAHV